LRVLITGATGFVGKHLITYLQGCNLVTLGRTTASSDVNVVHHTSSFDIDADYSDALQSVDVVVHCASVIQSSAVSKESQLLEMRDFNVRATQQLAMQAIASGAKKFIYLSSAKVNGETTEINRPFRESDEVQPTDAYAISKYEAEQVLNEAFKDVEASLIIVRPPLVYGDGVKGNFKSMIALAGLPLPLPFALFTENKRSMIYVSNLVDFIAVCIHSSAGDGTYLVADNEPWSTAGMFLFIYEALGCKNKLFPFPMSLFKVFLDGVGKRGIYERLCSSLELDNSLARSTFNWSPPFSAKEGILQTVSSCLKQEEAK